MRSLWAVAKNTIAQAVRMKVTVIFIILLIILLPVMSVAMPGDGTLKGRLQTFVSYGLGLTNLLLCLLTIIVSAYTLASDIKECQIYTVLTKPIRRFQFLCGKLLGIVLLDVVLLVLFSAIIYSIAICMPILGNLVWIVGLLSVSLVILFLAIIYTFTIHIRIFWKVFRLVCLSLLLLLSLSGLIYTITAYAPEFSQTELVQVENEFYTARAALAPVVVDVSEEVREKYEKLKQQGQLPAQFSPAKVLAELTRQKELEKRAAAPGTELVWEFEM